ncbi:MAG: hypothetical protein ABI321_03930 [Polyangia bacterium]
MRTILLVVCAIALSGCLGSVDLDQSVGTSTHTIQYLFFRECVGEVGRMVTGANETNENFTSAATFRRLAL